MTEKVVRRVWVAFLSEFHPATSPAGIDRIGHGEVAEASDVETE